MTSGGNLWNVVLSKNLLDFIKDVLIYSHIKNMGDNGTDSY